MPRKRKHKVTVELPTEFVGFMRHVNELICDGDETATTLESDDLLQCECVYGGLYNAAEGRFGFRYFLTDGATWDLDLNAQQIAKIANGTLVALDLWQCPGRTCDCLYATEDSYCMHCDSICHFDDYESRLRIRHPDEPDDVLAVMAQMRKIGLAILRYHNEHDHFPPLNIRDASGKPLHSWRSLILPYLDEESVFKSIDFFQPWDSETNRKVWSHRPEVYGANQCPVPRTPYVAIVGADTIWPVEGQRHVREIKSGTSFTVAAVAANETTVNWLQPADIDIETAIAEYTAKDSLVSVFVDGHVELLRGIDIRRLREMICI